MEFCFEGLPFEGYSNLYDSITIKSKKNIFHIILEQGSIRYFIIINRFLIS